MSARVALIGLGRWGAPIAAAARRAGLELVTCHARDPAARGAFAARAGCEAAATLEAAIAHPAVEGVLLVTPNDAHAEQALLAADHGRHVFVEKPIADTVEAGETMRDACERAGVALMVGHAFRRLGASRRVRELVDGGALGRVVLAEATMSLTDFGVWPDAQALDRVTSLTLDGAPVGFGEVDMLADELAEFGRCIREGVAPETGAAEGIAALRVVLDALHATPAAAGAAA